ncbi:MAG: histidine--tRNA ligase [Termitinemataceae bacterium]|nr:MAG: histidine--tRNA ligase [Termitinemataceae bacterium]
MIEAKILKGFRDFLPQDEIARKSLSEKAESVFRSFGYVPIDTPALEYTEILLGKGGGETEKQIYRFNDNGGRDVSLRFDLTVPFARYIAQHREELVFPFKRYHIAKVWRGENTQKGRYREFTQCDFDCIGADNAASDFEILFMIKTALEKQTTSGVTIHVNHRLIFNKFLKNICGANAKADTAEEILRIVDKLAKIGAEEVQNQLSALLDNEGAEKILDFISPKSTWDETFAAMVQAAGGEDENTKRLQTIHKFMIDAGVENSYVLDPSITRGLDYYTGIVFETFLNELPSIGSICSGGRYDNLMGLYSKTPLSGVGGSIGLDRLIAGLEALNISTSQKTYAKLCIANLNEDQCGLYQKLAAVIRDAGIPCEVLSEAKKQTAQFIEAEKKGAAYVLLPCESDPVEGPFVLRNLATRENVKVCGIAGLKSL